MNVSRNQFAIAGIIGALTASAAIATSTSSFAATGASGSGSSSVAASGTSTSTTASVSPTSSDTGVGPPKFYISAVPGGCSTAEAHAYRSSLVTITGPGTAPGDLYSIGLDRLSGAEVTLATDVRIARGQTATVEVHWRNMPTAYALALHATRTGQRIGEYPTNGGSPTDFDHYTRLCPATAAPTAPGEPPTPSPVTTALGVTG